MAIIARKGWYTSMNQLKKIYCRAFQAVFKMVIPLLPYRNPEIIGSLKAVPDVLKKKKCENVLIITDAGIRNLGLTERLEKALTDSGIPYTIYDKTVANPTTTNVAKDLSLCDQTIRRTVSSLDTHPVSRYFSRRLSSHIARFSRNDSSS